MKPPWSDLTHEQRVAAIKDYVNSLFIAQDWYNIGAVKGLFLQNLFAALAAQHYNAPAYPSPILENIVVWWNTEGRHL